MQESFYFIMRPFNPNRDRFFLVASWKTMENITIESQLSRLIDRMDEYFRITDATNGYDSR